MLFSLDDTNYFDRSGERYTGDYDCRNYEGQSILSSNIAQWNFWRTKTFPESIIITHNTGSAEVIFSNTLNESSRNKWMGVSDIKLETLLCTDKLSNYAYCTDYDNGPCTKCNPNYYMQPSISHEYLTSCPHGYWLDSRSWTCQPCYNTSDSSPERQSCRTCFSKYKTSCLSCFSSTYFFIIDHSCLKSCPNGFYALDDRPSLYGQCFTSSLISSDNTCLTCGGGSAS